MFAVFEKTTATIPEPPPAAVRLFGKMVVPAIPTADSVPVMKELLRRFDSVYPSTIAVNQLPSCIIASKLDEQSITVPSYFVVKDDMICVFNGELKNIANELKGKDNNEAVYVISAYRKCCGEANRETSWCNIVKDFQAEFSFVTFDARDKTFFASTDPLGTKVPCYWGKDHLGNIVFSTNYELAKACCDSFYGSILGGCYVTREKGLRSFQNPLEQINVEAIHSVSSPNKKQKV